jgi:hypothetical protein
MQLIFCFMVSSSPHYVEHNILPGSGRNGGRNSSTDGR